MPLWVVLSCAWGGSFLIAVASVIVSTLARKSGLEQAIEAYKGSREQAIRTEGLRLWYEVRKRRVAEFDHAATALGRYIAEQSEQRFRHFEPITFRMLGLVPMLAATLIDDAAKADAGELGKACHSLAVALVVERPPELSGVEDLVDAVILHLYRLKSVVDDAVERAVGTQVGGNEARR
jgi:hypothetical protein